MGSKRSFQKFPERRVALKALAIGIAAAFAGSKATALPCNVLRLATVPEAPVASSVPRGMVMLRDRSLVTLERFYFHSQTTVGA